MRKIRTWLGLGLIAMITPTTAAFANDEMVAAGMKVFNARCKVCHSAEADAKHKIGPNLFGVVGQAAGWQEGFRYSKGHRESGATWDDATLDKYLEDVDAVAPKSVKQFGGLSKPEDRAAIIAFLHTLQ